MRFTRSECPDCTKEVLMTRVREKRDLAERARPREPRLYGFFVWLWGLASGSGGSGRQRAGSGSASADSSVTFSVGSNATRSQIGKEYSTKEL